MAKWYKMMLCILLALFVSSCEKVGGSLPTIPPATGFVSPVSTGTIAPLATSTLPVTKLPKTTPNAVVPSPTWIVDSHPGLSLAFYSPNLVTDGKLQLSVGSFDTLCFHPGETVYFETIFANLSDEDITLVDYHYLSRKETGNSYGQVYPILTTLDGKEVYPGTYFSQDAAINPNPPSTIVIHPDVIFLLHEGYQIPKNIGVEDKDHNIKYQLLTPGKYLLKFVYVSMGYNDSWKGIISSNRIEVCIVE